MDESTIITLYRDIVIEKCAENEQLKQKNEKLTRKLKTAEGKLDIRRRETEDLINCPVCFFSYNHQYRLPVVGTCGHTICNSCARSLRKFNSSCPTCRAANSFCRPAKNFLAHDLLEQGNLFPTDETNTILIIGGTKNNKEYAGSFVLSSDRSKWIEVKFNLPYMVNGSGVVYYNEELYLIGGWKNSKSMYKLDKDLKWIRLTDMHKGRFGITKNCLAWNGYIWVFGGWDEKNNFIRRVERYDVKENKWAVTQKTSKYYGAAIVWKHRIAVTGIARRNVGKISIAGLLDPTDGSWTRLPNFPKYGRYRSIISYQEKIIIMGGRDENGSSNSIWELDPHKSNPTWNALPPMNIPRFHFGGAVLDGKIYAIGGTQTSRKRIDRVEIFDEKSWRDGPSLPYPMHNMSTVIIPQHFADRLCTHKP